MRILKTQVSHCRGGMKKIWLKRVKSSMKTDSLCLTGVPNTVVPSFFTCRQIFFLKNLPEKNYFQLCAQSAKWRADRLSMCSDMQHQSKIDRIILNEVITDLLAGFVSVKLKLVMQEFGLQGTCCWKLSRNGYFSYSKEPSAVAEVMVPLHRLWRKLLLTEQYRLVSNPSLNFLHFSHSGIFRLDGVRWC